ncbi:glycosyl hydrolase [Botrytis cinerea]
MHISLQHILVSLSAAALTSSVVEAIPTKIQRASDSSFLAKRASSKDSLNRADFQNYASSAINALQKNLLECSSWTMGSYDDSGKFSPQWWPSANVLTMMANYYGRYPTTATWMPDLFCDNLDACSSVYDVTGNETYLKAAAEIYEDPKSVYGNTPCGGLWWDKKHSGVNSVENELYLTASAKLANRLPARKNSEGQGYYYSQALIAYDFLITNTTTSMNPSTHLFNDGISMNTCKNNGKIVFTYNQGIILSGLTELTWSTRSHSYTALAVEIANSVIEKMTTSAGILQEKACEPNACNGDEQQFKGIFTRNLAFMINRATGMDANILAKYRDFLALNAESIIRDDTSSDNMLGLVWSGANKPVYSVETDGSALDTLVGAAITALD